MPHLAFTLTNGKEFTFDLNGGHFTLGRNQSNQIFVEDNFISSFHAELFRQPDGNYEIVDKNSTNGTFINGERIQRGLIKPGDSIRFGQVNVTFVDPLQNEPGHTLPLPQTSPPTSLGDPPKPAVAKPGPPPPNLVGSLPKPPVASPPAALNLRTESPAAVKPAADIRPIALPAESAQEELRQARQQLAALKEQNARAESSLTQLLHEESETRSRLEVLKQRAHKLNFDLDHLDALQQQIVSTEARQNDLSSALAVLQTQYEEREGRLKKTSESLLERQRALDLVRDNEKAQQQTLAQLNQQVAAERQRLEKLRADASQSETSLNERISALDHTLSDKQAELRTASEKLDLALGRESEIMGKLASLSDTDSRLQDASQTLKALEEQIARTQTHLLTLTQQREEKDNLIASLTEIGAAQHSLVQTLTRQREELEETLKTLQSTSDEKKNRIAGQEADIAGLAERIEAMERHLAGEKDAQARHADIQQKLTEAQALLTQTQDAFTSEKTKVARAADELSALMLTVATRREETQAAETRHQEALEKLAVLTKRLDELAPAEQKLNDLLTQFKERTAEKKALQEELNTLGKNRDQFRAEIDELTRQKNQLRSETVSLTERLQRDNERQRQLNDAIQQHETRLKELQSLVANTSSELQRLQADEGTTRKRLSDLQTETSTLQSAYDILVGKRNQEQTRLHNASTQANTTETKVAALLEQQAAVEDRLAHLIDQTSDLRSQEDALQERIHVIERHLAKLEAEERAAIQSFNEHQGLLAKASQTLQDIQQQIADNEERYANELRGGDQLLSLAEALAFNKQRHQETTAQLNETIETRNNLQAEIKDLNHLIAKQTQQLETLRQRSKAEEAELRTQLIQTSEELSSSTLRLGQLKEKEKLIASQVASNTDQQTVILFAHDLIHRFELLDFVIQRASTSKENADLVRQLKTLRASFEDIFTQHYISEFSLPPGMELDGGLRQRVNILGDEDDDDGAPAKVREIIRVGYIYQPPHGLPLVLRKADIKIQPR